MQLTPAHAEHSISIPQTFIRQNPLGLPPPSLLLLTRLSKHKGTLEAHMARTNPQTKAIIDALALSAEGRDTLEEEVLVVYSAPVHSYVTPKFYKQTKPESGKVVPTWDYAAVQAYGKTTIYHANNPFTGTFLTKALTDLSIQEERTMLRRMGEEGGGPWQLGDAPENYVEVLKKGIIGIDIALTKLEGRFKLSQEKTGGDWEGVVAALITGDGDVMADMVEKRTSVR
ncbi:hypothetical protein IAR50_005385 [Cryptococcus sp. DSM 104548]